MRALTLRPPWAHAIAHLGKDVENRTFGLAMSAGPLLIHAGKGCTPAYYAQAAKAIRAICGAELPPLGALAAGVVVGIAHVTAIGVGNPSRWALLGNVHWQIGRFVAMPHVHVTGRQGLFQVTSEQLGKHGVAYAQAWAEIEQIGRAA